MRVHETNMQDYFYDVMTLACRQSNSKALEKFRFSNELVLSSLYYAIKWNDTCHCQLCTDGATECRTCSFQPGTSQEKECRLSFSAFELVHYAFPQKFLGH